MKIKLDENMPEAIADLLRSTGHDAVTVPQERLSGAEDSAVLKAAATEGRLLMTFDTDFADIRAYPPGTHAGIVVFRLPDHRWSALKEPAAMVLEQGVLERLRGGLAVVSDTRIRTRPGREIE
jgi:predicted nuclease of predicted toxin-antitoxin system